MINFYRKFILIFLPVMTLTACGNNGVAEVQEWMEQVKKETHIVVAKISPPKVYIPFAYAGKSNIDPFNPAKLLAVLARIKAESSSGLKPDMERRREVLESYPLDTLKMVGFIEKPNLRYALIQVDKTIFQAKIGNYIGQDFGVITKVTETEIEIKEIVQDAAGEWTERRAKLELQEAKK